MVREKKENAGKKTRKERMTVYVSPYMYKEIKEMIERGEFSSESDVGYHAISMFINEYKKEKEKKKEK